MKANKRIKPRFRLGDLVLFDYNQKIGFITKIGRGRPNEHPDTFRYDIFLTSGKLRQEVHQILLRPVSKSS